MERHDSFVRGSQHVHPARIASHWRWRWRSGWDTALAFNLIGLGLGPLVVGFASDLLQASYGIYGLRYALALSMFGVLIGSLLFWLAAKQYKPQTIQ